MPAMVARVDSAMSETRWALFEIWSAPLDNSSMLDLISRLEERRLPISPRMVLFPSPISDELPFTCEVISFTDFSASSTWAPPSLCSPRASRISRTRRSVSVMREATPSKAASESRDEPTTSLMAAWTLDRSRPYSVGLLGGRLGEAPDLVRDDREALARLARVGRLDRRVHREKVGLRRDGRYHVVGLEEGARAVGDLGDALADSPTLSLPDLGGLEEGLELPGHRVHGPRDGGDVATISSIAAEASVTLAA